MRAQKFTWNADDTPNFGEPVAAGVTVESPAGENGPLVTKVQGTKIQLVSKANEKCIALDANGKVIESACGVPQSEWTLDYTTQGNYRLVSDSGLFFGEGNEQCVNNVVGELNASPWHSQQCQQWQLTPYHQGWLTIVNAQSKKELGLAECKEPETAAEKNLLMTSLC